MKLHENMELFQNYIALASQKEEIDEAIDDFIQMGHP